MSFDFAAVLNRMVELGASDVHLTPGFPPAIRVRGQITPMEGQTPLTPQETREVVYSILNDDQRKRFENNMQLDFAYAIPNVARFRVNCFFQRGAISAAFRFIPESIKSLGQLGLPPVLEEFTRKPRGFVLVTGPTGSGKTTSLAAMIDSINAERDEHILTIEDPIEFMHPHKRCIVNQREIGADAPDFAAALKAALRQDPDVILVGEMRDLETIEAALTIAETGHLVFATLHTNSAVSSINRIIDVFPPHQQDQIRNKLSFVLQAVITQQLLARAGTAGRCLAMEIMIPNVAIRNLIRENKIHQIYGQMQVGQERFGMVTLNQSLLNLFSKRFITLEQAIANSNEPDELKIMIERAGLAAAAAPRNQGR